MLTPRLQMSPSKLVDIMQETSTMNTENTDIPLKWYVENNMAWVITHWDIKFIEYPKLNDSLVCCTYPTAFRSTQGSRMFEVHRDDGTAMALGHSHWMLVDLAEKKLVRPPQNMIDGYGETKEPPFVGDYAVFKTKEMTEINSERFTAHRSALDSNNHVNNTVYIDWALNAIPDDIYDKNVLNRMKIVYHNQCLYRDLVDITVNQLADGNHLAYAVRDDGTLLTKIYMEWRAIG
jgi:medium-chain acyl-[acyl-carrier-protein] hydrolase